ncbi:UNVERIFIED_ORG: hypothetical protein J2W85_004540 [Ensifer adhaerens]|nr:hypothetical protein [Ensifer adhaerens]
MKPASLALAVAATFLLSSCQTDTETLTTHGPSSSSLSEPAVAAISGDIVSRLAEQVAPGSAPLRLDEDQSPHGVAWQSALRSAGYVISAEPAVPAGKRALDVTYGIDEFEGQILARLAVGTVEITRGYNASLDGAMPVTPLSVITRN